MFFNLPIDVFLINKLQSFVTWCEYKTEITRANLGYLLLAFSYIPLIILGLLLLGCLLAFNISTLSLVFSTSGTLFVLISREKLLKKNLEDSFKIQHKQLPKEIQERSFVRVIILLFTFAMLLSAVDQIFNFPEKSAMTPNQAFTILSVFFSAFLFSTITEYFLCTIDLPPKEKERNRREKEASKMVPQKT